MVNFFLMNWPGSSHFTKDSNDTSHTNGIYTYTPEDRTVTSPPGRWPNKHLPNTNSSWHDTCQINWQKCPNSTPCSQMVLDVRYTSEPIDKMPKWYSVLTNCLWCQIHVRINWQNAQITLRAQKRSLPGSTPGDLLSLGASQISRCSFCFIKEKCKLAAKDSAGKWK